MEGFSLESVQWLTQPLIWILCWYMKDLLPLS